MKSSSLEIGQLVKCKRYYVGGDLVEGLVYEVQATATVDGYIDHSLSNGDVAILILNESINVKQAGAVGDGISDDTLSIKAALTSFSNVLFSEGSYSITSNIAITKENLSLIAKGAVTILPQGAGVGGGGNFDTNVDVFSLSISGKFYLSGFVFDGGDSWVFRSIDLIGSTKAVVEDCIWKDFRYPSLDYTTTNLSSGIRFNGCSNYTIQNCKFLNMYYRDIAGNLITNATATNGEKLGRAIGNGATGENGNFLNNYFFETRTSVVLTHDNTTFQGNTWDTWSDNAIYDLGTNVMKVVGNSFSNSTDEAIVTSGANKTITNNSFFDVGNKCIAFIGDSDRYIIANNSFRSQSGELNAIVTRTEWLTTSTRSNVIISNNTFKANQFGFGVIYLGDTNQLEVTNNLFEFETVFSSASQYVVILTGGSDPLFTISGNSVQSLGVIADLRFVSSDSSFYYHSNVSNINLLISGTINRNTYEALTAKNPRVDWSGVATTSTEKGQLHLKNPDNAISTKISNGAFVTAEADANNFSSISSQLMGAVGFEYDNATSLNVDSSYVVYLADDASKTLIKAFSINHNGLIELFGNGQGIIAKSPDGTRYSLSAPNGGGTASWIAV